ncbi:transcriptional regulator [Streptococcus infantarius subsp. infantarius]|nr:transcriptional regulator [Streptococcus infantarius subsp. infantarius]
MELERRLAELRKEKNISQEEIAENFMFHVKQFLIGREARLTQISIHFC